MKDPIMRVAALCLPAFAALFLLLPAAAAAAESGTILGFLDSWTQDFQPAAQIPCGNAAACSEIEDDSTIPAAPARITLGVSGELVPIAGGPKIRIPRPPRIPAPPGIPVPGVGVPTPHLWFPGYKSPSAAWILSFLIPGLGQYYVGGHTGVIMGTIHAGIFCTAALGMLIWQDSDDNVVLACAAAAVLNWFVSWIEAPILALVHNRYAYSMGLLVDYDQETKALGMGLHMKF
jgi:hypothetical protein